MKFLFLTALFMVGNFSQACQESMFSFAYKVKSQKESAERNRKPLTESDWENIRSQAVSLCKSACTKKAIDTCVNGVKSLNENSTSSQVMALISRLPRNDAMYSQMSYDSSEEQHAQTKGGIDL